jgi:UDP-GlcNAc3NAcA epimerase
VAHVEAGLRSFDMAMPEEINRRLTDHLSRLLFCPTKAAVENLRSEGIVKGVHRVGDVMVDALEQNLARAKRLARLPAGLTPKDYYLATLHRQENVDDPARLRGILDALGRLPRPVLLPLHPRTRERLAGLGVAPGGAIRVHPPASYLEMLLLESNARLVLTDSGGVQKEAFILGTPCVTLREQTEWVETVEAGANVLVGANPTRILRAVRAIERARARAPRRHPYGDGHASERIAEVLARFVAAARSG